MPVHVHHAGVLPPAGQTVHDVADAASNPQHTPTLPIRTQVSRGIPAIYAIRFLRWNLFTPRI